MPLKNSVENRKAFILDTITSTPCSRGEVILGLALKEHIDPIVWEVLGEYCRTASGPEMDFIACLPAKTQMKIAEVIITENVSLGRAITTVTGEIISVDATHISQLGKVWRVASPAAREKFLAIVAPQK